MGKSPDAFRTISEVADWLDTQAHVLRFWESKFTQVKPVKRAGGRRYYRPADMLLLGGIKKLLHDDGMTIKGAQKLLREKGTKYVAGLSQPLDPEDDTAPTDDIGMTEATPPPLEQERGTVLSFDRREETPAEQEDRAQSTAPKDASPPTESDEPPLEAPESGKAEETEEDDLPAEDIPSFVQRLTPKATPPKEEDEATAPVTDGADEATQATPAQEDGTPEESPEPQDDTAEETREPASDPAQEPGPSVLSDIATMSRIAPENRAEVEALLDRLTALCERMEAAENA